MSGNVIVFMARVLVLVKQRRRCPGAMKILPKAARDLTNTELSKDSIGKMLVDALRYARYNCASYEKDHCPR